VIDEKAATNASSKAGKVRGLRDRKRDFTFDQQFSIGFRSGEYAGRNRTHAPTASMASSMSSSLWIGLLAMNTILPRVRVGTSSSSTKNSTDAIKSDSADRRDVAPPIIRNLIEDPFAGFRSAVQPGKPKITAHFVNKDVFADIESVREFPELFAGLFVAFTGDEAFFYGAGAGPVSCGRS